MKVSLIRHGRPAADLSTRITGREFAAWLAAYDQAGLDRSCPPPSALLSSLADCRLLLTSPTRRASESAHCLAAELGPAFVPAPAPDAIEAPLPTSLAWPFPTRSTILVVVARALWLLRLARAKENKPAVNLRARRLAEHLATCSREAGHVALVGHGYMHIFTRRALETSGWKCLRAQGHGYWSCAQFER
jgi:phosphohistidine phosphatase SixA